MDPRYALLLLVHLIGITGYTLLLRKSAISGVDPIRLAYRMQLAIFAPTLLFVLDPRMSFDHTPEQWAALIGSGGFIVGLHVIMVRALSHADAATFSLVYNLRLPLITLGAWLVLSEMPTSGQLLGGALVFSSVLCLNLHRDWRAPGIRWSLLLVVWFGAHGLLEKHNVSAIGVQDYLVYSQGTALVLLWAWSRRRPAGAPMVGGRPLTWLLLLRVMSAWGYIAALAYGPVAVANYVSGMSVALVFFLGAWVLEERDHLGRKALAVSMALAGFTCILLW